MLDVRRTARRLLPLLAAATAAAIAAAAAVAAAPADAAAAPQTLTWGYNSLGQLGDGTTISRSTPAPVTALSPGPRQVAVDLDGTFDVAVNADGTVSAWGLNNQGQLGDGTTTNRLTPVKVPGLSGITQVSAGGNYVLALGSDGTVWAWGSNATGQLGDGTTISRPVPQRVPELTGITQVAAGGVSGYALRSDGTVWDWGDNQYGQLGNGTTTSSLVPEQQPSLTGIGQITAGVVSALALRSDGTLAAWGDNAAGALGDGTTTTRLSPVPVPFVSGVTQVSTSSIHTLAIAGGNGQVWAWGGNGVGELGDGTTTSHPVPEQIGVTGATQVDAGRDDSAAVRSDGSLLAWGDDSFGQLGFAASATPQLTPRAVTGLTGVTQALISNDQSVAIAQPPVSHVIVPDVTGDAPAQAAAAIRSAGLTVGSTGFATSCDVPVGTIIRTIPAAGSLVAPGATVGVIRSRALSPDCA
jgi:alpha-tubulin suppressor-like RCC1 family protein